MLISLCSGCVAHIVIVVLVHALMEQAVKFVHRLVPEILKILMHFRMDGKGSGVLFSPRSRCVTVLRKWTETCRKE